MNQGLFIVLSTPEVSNVIPANTGLVLACPIPGRSSASPIVPLISPYVSKGFPFVLTPQNKDVVPLLRIGTETKQRIAASFSKEELAKIRADTFRQEVIRSINVTKLQNSKGKKGLADMYSFEEIRDFAEALSIPITDKVEMINKLLDIINKQ